MKKNTVLLAALAAALIIFILSCSKRTNIHPLSPDDMATSTMTRTVTRTRTPVIPTVTYTKTCTPSCTYTAIIISATDTPFFSATQTPTVTTTSTDTSTDTPTNTVTVTPTFSVNGPPWPFNTDAMSFTNDTVTDLACTSVTWDGNAADAWVGPGSIYGTFNFSASATVQGLVYRDTSASPLDMTNLSLNVWVNIPAAIAGQGYGLQLVAKDPGWNAKWFNITASGWQLFTFDVNAPGVTEVGVMISRNGSAVAYAGNIQIDEMYTSVMTPPGPPWTFDLNSEKFMRNGEPAITGLQYNTNPAGIKSGSGSLMLTTDFSSSATASGAITRDLATPLDLTGKEFSIWLYVPAAMAGQGYGIQLAALTGADSSGWNAQWFNLDTAGWVNFTWIMPPLTDVTRVELEILRNSSPVAYTGVMYTDEWTIIDAPTPTMTITPTQMDTPVDTDTPISTPTATPTTVISTSGPPWPFNTDTMGFTNDTITDLACTSVTWDGNPADAEVGPGSIYGTFNFSASATVQGYVLNTLTTPLDMTNKALNVWVNVPASMAGQGYGLQLVAKDPGWNAQWFNLTNPGWQLFTFNVNAAGVTEVGVMISRNGSAFAYTGNIQIDEMYITTMVQPGPPWTFDADTMGFTYSSTDVAITALSWNSNPANIEAGTGSLAMTADFSYSANAQGDISKDLTSTPLDFSGKTFSVWLYVPASIAGTGWGLQLAALTGPTYSWNAKWFNLDTAGWVKFSWDLISLPDVRQIQMQVLRNGSSTSYTGTLYTDEWNLTTTPVVTSVYNFDTSAQGWTNDTITDLAVTAVSWDSNPADAEAGTGSLLCTADFTTSLTAQGYIYVDLSSAPVDLTGKTLVVWMNVPAGMVGYGAQIAYKTTPAKNWNASWENITAAGWQKFTCSPNMADVEEIGIQFLRNSAPTAFSGTFNIDEVTYY